MKAPDLGSILERTRRAHPQGNLAPLELALEQCGPQDAWALDAAASLCELQLDPEAIAAALVFGRSQRETLDEKALVETYGQDVGDLVSALFRIQGTRWDHLEEEAAENLRNMFLAMAADIRVVLVALAIQVGALRTVEDRTSDEARRLARETVDVFAPLANRLGVWQLKWALEDLAFRILDPDTYAQMKRMLAENRRSRERYVEDFINTLGAELERENITGQISGRPKHIYSIYKKMRRKGVGFEEIYDVTAARVIVDEVPQCYAVLGLVHALWPPIPGEFDDYIAKPKDNFYRSLHTAVVGPEGKPLEVQIRTREMHQFAEFGVAAHWRYKEGGKHNRDLDEKIAWLRQLMEWQKEVADPREFVESLRTDVFQDQIYVFTPAGDILDLPVGATAIDFAYRVHTEVGNRCKGARINGQIAPLDRALQTGDRIEILTQKNGAPSRDWLNPHLGYVRTASARQKIRHWFRLQQRDTSIAQGRELLAGELKRLGLEGKPVGEICKLMQLEKPDDLLAGLGFGDISLHQISGRLLEAERPPPPPPSVPAKPPAAEKSPRGSSVSIAGIDDVLSQPARCCAPVPGDDVVGYITRGRGLIIHRRDCPNVVNHPEPERLMDVEWGKGAKGRFPVHIQILAHDRPGVLRDVMDAVALEGIGLSAAEVSTDPRTETARVMATLDVTSSAQVVRVLDRLGRLPYVTEAIRVRR